MEDDDRGDQLSEAHRQAGWMLVFTLALIVFLLYTTLAAIPGGQGLFLVLILLPTPLVVIMTRGYFNKKPWALPWIISIWVMAIAACFLLMLVEMMAALSGDMWSVIQSALLLFLCWSMSQRLNMLRHPIFRAWYDGVTPSLIQNIALQQGELLASCPHCQSLLAVRADKLHHDDLCPNCNGRLVLQSTVEQFLEEE